MPSERFFKLSEEKRDKVFRAALKEFCSEPMENISINRIIKEAGISRGSFYTYFLDKQDVLNYIGKEMQRQNEDTLKACILKAKGKFFDALELYMEDALEYLMKNHFFQLQKNVAIYADINPLHALEATGEDGLRKGSVELAEWCLAHVDRNELRAKDATEFLNLLMLSYVNVMITVVQICVRPELEQDFMAFHRKRMEYIKEGALSKHE